MEILKDPDKTKIKNEKYDKITTLKCSLKNIIIEEKYDNVIECLNDVCIRANEIIFHTYMFLRLWILKKSNDKKEIPLITKETIKMAFKSLIKESRGPKPKNENLEIYNEFKKFYETEYKILGLSEKLDGKYLSQILEYTSTDMITNIENNIKLNFENYVKRFVNTSFKQINENLIKSNPTGKQRALRTQLNKELYFVKQDLFNNTLLSDKKYHEWINKHKINIFPKEHFNDNNIKYNPQSYINSMIYMCNQIETLGNKLFQFFPLRTDIIPKYIPIDTKTLIEIFIKKNKLSYLKDIECKKQEIWESIFDLKQKIFKCNNFVFNYLIYTDCQAVSISMLNKKEIENVKTQKQKKKNKKKENRENREKLKNMKEEEILKETEKENNKIKKAEYIKKKETMIKQKKEAFKELSSEEKTELIKKYNMENGNDCKYIDDLSKEELKELESKTWVVVDTGIRVPLYMKSNKETKKEKNPKKRKEFYNGTIYRYSNKKHAFRIKRFIFRKKLNNYKKKHQITEKENKLSGYNSKSVNYKIFTEYIKNKIKINKELYEKYRAPIFRKYKWYGYINKKKTEGKLIKDIKDKFGKEVVIILGDASMKGNCKKGNISIPSERFKNLLMKHFKVYKIDEFRTSKLHYKTEEETENFYHIDKNKVIEKRKLRKIHAVLTYKMENQKYGCINRDANAVNNMIKIVESHILKGERPLKYRRDYKNKMLEPSVNTESQVQQQTVYIIS